MSVVIAQRTWERPSRKDRMGWTEARNFLRHASGLYTKAQAADEIIDDAIDRAVELARGKGHQRQLWQVNLTSYTDEIELPWAPSKVLLAAVHDRSSDAGAEVALGFGYYAVDGNRWRWQRGSDGWLWTGEVQLALWVAGPPQPRTVEVDYCTLERNYLSALGNLELWPYKARRDGMALSEIDQMHEAMRERVLKRLPRMLLPPHIPARGGKSISTAIFQHAGQTDVDIGDLN
jgi:hypothetical protein